MRCARAVKYIVSDGERHACRRLCSSFVASSLSPRIAKCRGYCTIARTAHLVQQEGDLSQAMAYCESVCECRRILLSARVKQAACSPSSVLSGIACALVKGDSPRTLQTGTSTKFCSWCSSLSGADLRTSAAQLSARRSSSQPASRRCCAFGGRATLFAPQSPH